MSWHGRCVCSNERAVVLMMKGADPVYQLDLRADPPCIKSQRPGNSGPHSSHLRHLLVPGSDTVLTRCGPVLPIADDEDYLARNCSAVQD